MRQQQYFDIHLCGCNHYWINISSVIISFNALPRSGSASAATSVLSQLCAPQISIHWVPSPQRCPWWHIKANPWLWITYCTYKLELGGVEAARLNFKPGSHRSTRPITLSSFHFEALCWRASSSAVAQLTESWSQRQQLNGHAWFIYFMQRLQQAFFRFFSVLRASSPDSNLDDAYKISPASPSPSRP